MGYEKVGFTSYQTLTAEQMNKIEDALYTADAKTFNGKPVSNFVLTSDSLDADYLGGVLASNYALKTDTIANSTKLNSQNSGYYTIRYNLLDNSDFRNPVNQRGQSSYTGSGYTIDRWRTWQDNAAISIQDGYITHEQLLYQYVPTAKPNQTYTIAVCNMYDEVFTYTGKPEADAGTAELGIHYDANIDCVFVVILGAVYGIKWAALYEGEYTAETLPEYMPKGYAAEYAECRRYYQVLDGYGLGYGYTTDGNDITCIVSTNVQMRAKPVFVCDGAIYCRCGGDFQVTFRDIYMGDRGNAAVVRLSFIQTSGSPPLYSPAQFFTLGNAALSADL